MAGMHPVATPDSWVTAWEPQDDGGVHVQFTYMDGKTAWVHLAEQAIGRVDLKTVAAGARERPPKLLGRQQQAQRAAQIQR